MACVSSDVARNVGSPAGIAVNTQNGRAGLRQGMSSLLADPLPGTEDHEAAALEVEQLQVLYGGSGHGDYLLLLIFCGRSGGDGRSSSLRRRGAALSSTGARRTVARAACLAGRLGGRLGRFQQSDQLQAETGTLLAVAQIELRRRGFDG